MSSCTVAPLRRSARVEHNSPSIFSGARGARETGTVSLPHLTASSASPVWASAAAAAIIPTNAAAERVRNRLNIRVLQIGWNAAGQFAHSPHHCNCERYSDTHDQVRQECPEGGI